MDCGNYIPDWIQGFVWLRLYCKFLSEGLIMPEKEFTILEAIRDQMPTYPVFDKCCCSANIAENHDALG